jgi:hypothetical protein
MPSGRLAATVDALPCWGLGLGAGNLAEETA